MTRPLLTANDIARTPDFPSPQVLRVERERRTARLGVLTAAAFLAAMSVLLATAPGAEPRGTTPPAFAAR